jgi:predicted SnoaL-like aldol condensation-catalyzing enzyme
VPNNPRQQAVELLKSFETGDRKSAAHINPNNYTQHNLAIADGLAGHTAVLQALPKGSARVNTIRVFQDSDYVFLHTEYNFISTTITSPKILNPKILGPKIAGPKIVSQKIFDGPKIGFDIFRFEGGKAVEHWDNLQQTPSAPSPSGHTMTDGPTSPADLHKTESNKALMQTYMDDLLAGRRDKFPDYFDGINYIQHNPCIADNLTGLINGLQDLAKRGKAVRYERVHKILGEGSFVLVVSEGTYGDKLTAYYDLYRIHNNKIAEHWDTLETIPPSSEWKNPNGKF